MKKFVKVLLYLALITALVFLWVNLSAFGPLWFPEGDYALYAKIDKSGQVTAMMFNKNTSGWSFSTIDAAYIEGEDDIASRQHDYSVKGQSPNLLFGRIYSKNSNPLGTRIAPSGFNVNIMELDCVNAFSHLVDNVSPDVGDTIKDTFYINENELRIGSDVFKRVSDNPDEWDDEETYVMLCVTSSITHVADGVAQ